MLHRLNRNLQITPGKKKVLNATKHLQNLLGQINIQRERKRVTLESREMIRNKDWRFRGGETAAPGWTMCRINQSVML